MGRMGGAQRVVRSIPDRSGNNYTKTSQGGKARAGSAVKYMDEQERTQLYTLEDGRFTETDRLEAVARTQDTQTKYQQHLAFTTQLPGEAEINQRQAAQFVAQAVQERRPDADIYAVAVHQQEGGNIHVHVCFGTDTTLRRGAEGDLVHFQHQAYQLERELGRELGLTHDRADDQQHKHASGKPLELDPEDFKSARDKQRERQRDYGRGY